MAKVNGVVAWSSLAICTMALRTPAWSPGIIGHLRALLAHDMRNEAAAITPPTLLITGERDPLTRSRAHWALHAALPQAQLVGVPGAGHVTLRAGLPVRM